MINISKLCYGLAGESDDLRYSSADSSGPVVVYNCTNRCNLKCLHCYSSSNASPRSNELTTNQAKRLLAELAELNCPVILFSGGEPLLRDDLFELLVEAKKLGLRTVISTNGTLIDSAIAGKLAAVGVSYVGISIDGDEQFHDRFRAAEGSYKAAIAGIENSKKAGIKTGLRFTITKSNFEQIPAVFDIAASLNTRRICFYHLIKTGRAKQLDEQILSSQQTRHAIDTIIEKTDDFARKGLVDEVLTVGNHADGPYLLLKLAGETQGSELVSQVQKRTSVVPLKTQVSERDSQTQERPFGDTPKTQNYERSKQLLLANGGNRTGEKIVCIKWDGSVHADQFWLNYSLGNVKNKTFRQIWEDSSEPVLNKLRNKSKFADARCLACKWFDLCKGNFRFLGAEADEQHWLNEPACYLADEEIMKTSSESLEGTRSL